jgi:carbamoylphosphate synthase small subunit
MKRIIQVSEVIDNYGEVQYDTSAKGIKQTLQDPECWTDDLTFTYEMNGERGVCFIDDLIGQEVIVGNEVILVQE